MKYYRITFTPRSSAEQRGKQCSCQYLFHLVLSIIFCSRSSSVALHYYGSLKCSSQLNQERLIIASHNLHNCLFVIWVTSVNICFVTFMIYINIAIYEIKIISPVINMMMIIIVILNIMIMIIIYLLLLIIIIIMLLIITISPKSSFQFRQRQRLRGSAACSDL